MQEILGQKQAVSILQQALGSGRMHHAWIFSGPVGVGKFTTALAVARKLLSPADHGGEQTFDPHTHPDLHIIRKELALYSDNPKLRDRKLMNIPIDLLRERMIGGTTSDDRQHEAAAYRTPVLGRGKVFIIDEAELIDPVGQNALLKTLEEPPDQTYIFLITSNTQRLIPTIHSRCQHVQFGRLSDEAMEAWMERAQIDLSPDEKRDVLQWCGGSPGLALVAVEYGFTQWKDALSPMIDNLRAGTFHPQLGPTMAQLVDDFSEQWVNNHDQASKDAANKQGLKYLLMYLAAYCRRAMTEAHDEEDDLLLWSRVIDLLRQAELQGRSHVNLKLLLDNLAAQWAYLLRRSLGGVAS